MKYKDTYQEPSKAAQMRAQERRQSAIDSALERHGASKKPVTLPTLEWQRKWLSEE